MVATPYIQGFLAAESISQARWQLTKSPQTSKNGVQALNYRVIIPCMAFTFEPQRNYKADKNWDACS